MIKQEGVFKYLAVLFNLLSAPYWFQYNINILLASVPTIIVIIYLDDVIVYSDT